METLASPALRSRYDGTENVQSFGFHLLWQTELAGLQVWSGLQVMVPLPLTSWPRGQVTRTDCPTRKSGLPLPSSPPLQPGGGGQRLAAGEGEPGETVSSRKVRLRPLRVLSPLTSAGGERGAPGASADAHHQRLPHQLVAFVALDLHSAPGVQVVLLHPPVQRLFGHVAASSLRRCGWRRRLNNPAKHRASFRNRTGKTARTAIFTLGSQMSRLTESRCEFLVQFSEITARCFLRNSLIDVLPGA